MRRAETGGKSTRSTSVRIELRPAAFGDDAKRRGGAGARR